MTDAIRILVIDDSEDDRELYRRALQKNVEARYEVSEAADGDAGLKQIDERALDCVLLDYSLPGRNGIEVLKRIHAMRPFLPVVMLTGQGSETVAVTAMREGAQNYISKSTITPEAIHHAVRVAIEHCEMEKRIADQRNSLEIFTRALAHDLKEPVRTITSFLDLLSAQEKLSEQGNNYFGHIKNAARRMHSLIDTVHFYTRLDGAPEEIPKEACSLAGVLEEVKENVAELIRERKPEIAADELPFVQANRAQLLQVMQNLLCNAIYHSDKNPRIAITVKDADKFWALRISDNGKGIAEADREKIFQPFTRLAGPHGRGMGMGLAICRRIVESHGGTIRCEAGEGGGASFVLTLPKAVGAAIPVAAPKPEERPVAAGVSGLANVLLVDDNEADLELTQIMLTERAKLRCNFLVAQDAFEALVVLRKEQGKADRVDLVLLDINMPGMSGLELLAKMRGEDGLKHVPVVICSTSSYDRDISQAKALGALGYITKPTEMTKLEPLLKRAPGLQLATKDGVHVLNAAA